MTKFTVVLLFAIAGSVYGRSMWDNYFNQDQITKRESEIDENYVSTCTKLEDTRCVKYTMSKCETNANVRYICPRLCGSCAPFTGNCPSEYAFGCCWNGDEATGIDKTTTCPKCQDLNHRICQRPHIIKECDLHPNSQTTRRLCPETCKACKDFGN